MERLVVDIEKLHEAINTKRRRYGTSWGRLAAQWGVSKSSLVSLARPNSHTGKPKKDITSTLLVNVLQYLKRPYEDFVKTEKLEVFDHGVIGDE